MSSEFSLEDLLDSVADAVSALVLFANEVSTDRKKLTNLQEGVKMVQSATAFFTSDAGRTIKMWRDFGNEQMAMDMQEACDGINEASAGAVESVQTLMKDEKSMEAKNRLLDAGKAILKHMVRLLQLNDLYEVTVILKQIQAVRQMLNTRDDLKFAVSEFSLMSNYLSKILSARTKRCYDGSVRSALEEAAIEIGRTSIPMLEVQQEWLDSPTVVSLKERREMYASSLVYALKRAHDATRASAKSPFDLSMLDRNHDMDFDEDFVALNNANWENGLDALQSAIKNGDEAEMESALRALKKDLLSQLDAAEEAARNIDDPNLRDRLLDAIARLRKQLGDMIDKLTSDAREALKKRDPEMIRSALEELKLLRARILDGLAKDNLLQHAVNIDSLMRSLLDAAKAGDVRESKAIVNDIGNEVNDMDDLISTLAANVTDDASRRKRLEDGMANLKRHLAALGQLTGQAMDDPNNDDLWRRLQELMDRIRGVTNDLINASLQTTPQELLGLGANLEEALRRLLEAARNAHANPDQVAVEAANAIAKLKPALDLAGKFAEHADAHTAQVINKNIEEAKLEAAKMAQAAREVAAAAKSGSKPDYDAAFDRLRKALERLRALNGGIIDAALADTEAEMKRLTEQLDAARNRLLKALKNGDMKEAIMALADFQDLAARKALLARIIARDTDDEELRRKLLELADRLDFEAGKTLVDAVKEALRNQKDAAAYEKALAKLNKALEIAKAMDSLAVSASPEEKYAANGKVLIRTAELVKLSVNDGNFADAAGHLKDLREQLGRHRQLANQIGEACAHDPSVAQRLNAQNDRLDDLYKQIVVATKAATTDPSKKATVAQLVAEFQRVAAQSSDEAKKAKESAAAEKKRLEEEAAAEAKRRKEAEEDLAGKNEIYRAAHKVTQAVNAADDIPDDGSPMGMLVFTAKKMGAAMKTLSELSEGTDNATTIAQARQIAALTSDLQKYANLVAGECSDPKLAQELRDYATYAKNFSIQLKIVCAVKASSGDDATAQKSLVTCAQGLCKNVVECVDVSRVARLKKKLK